MNRKIDIGPLSAAVLGLELRTSRGAAKLSDFLGHQLVIFFYPKDDTPGCTAEGKDFSALHKNFLLADTQVIGISRDSLVSHEKFITKYGLSITLVADLQESACKAFGVLKEKNLYGKTFIGIERSTFLIDAAGSVRRVWRNVKVPGHAHEVLAAARKQASL
ncbi:MAG: peroxiredoxin [Betaproteobacteria bacterium]|nr:peroxiredoxin [Betaproteobacteria bacterium]